MMEYLLFENCLKCFNSISDIEPVFQRQDIEKQLDFIKDEVELLHEVNKESRRLMQEQKRKTLTNGKAKEK